jgi:hypothetical protein
MGDRIVGSPVTVSPRVSVPSQGCREARERLMDSEVVGDRLVLADFARHLVSVFVDRRRIGDEVLERNEVSHAHDARAVRHELCARARGARLGHIDDGDAGVGLSLVAGPLSSGQPSPPTSSAGCASNPVAWAIRA